MSEESTVKEIAAEESAPMTLEERFPHITPEYLEELGRLGQAIYDKLKPEIEPLHDRKFITIHVDTGDYAIGKNSSTATRAIRQRHDLDGRLFCRKIGNEPEYGTLSLLLSSGTPRERNK